MYVSRLASNHQLPADFTLYSKQNSAARLTITDPDQHFLLRNYDTIQKDPQKETRQVPFRSSPSSTSDLSPGAEEPDLPVMGVVGPMSSAGLHLPGVEKVMAEMSGRSLGSSGSKKVSARADQLAQLDLLTATHLGWATSTCQRSIFKHTRPQSVRSLCSDRRSGPHVTAFRWVSFLGSTSTFHRGSCQYHL